MAATRIVGFVSVVDLAAYDALAREFQDLRGDYWKPYLLAFQHQVELMGVLLDEQGVAPAEHIAFGFDQTSEFATTAEELFASVQRSSLTYAPRLGSLAFVESCQTPAIQAADLLAYEARREFVHRAYATTKKHSRRQWQRLHESNQTARFVRHFDGAALAEVVDYMRKMPQRSKS